MQRAGLLFVVASSFVLEYGLWAHGLPGETPIGRAGGGGGWRSCWFSSARPGSSAYLAPSWPDGDFVPVGMCLPHTQTGRHTLRSPPCDHPSRGAWHSTVCCLGDSLGLCPRALPREEYSRDDKAAQSLRDGPVPAPPAIDSRAEEPSPEVTCLKSPNAGARAAQLQACRLSAVSLPRG